MREETGEEKKESRAEERKGDERRFDEKRRGWELNQEDRIDEEWGKMKGGWERE